MHLLCTSIVVIVVTVVVVVAVVVVVFTSCYCGVGSIVRYTVIVTGKPSF